MGDSGKIKKYIEDMLDSKKLLYPQSIKVLEEVKGFIEYNFPERIVAKPFLLEDMNRSLEIIMKAETELFDCWLNSKYSAPDTHKGENDHVIGFSMD